VISKSFLSALWLSFLILLATPAHADELRPGYLEFTQVSQSDWLLVWKSPVKGGIASETKPVLPNGCAANGPTDFEVINATIVLKSKVICKSAVAGQMIGLSNFGGSQTDVLVRIAPLGRPVQVMRLTAAEPVTQIPNKPDRWQVARTYFVTGVEHILFGYDHLLFVLALVLLLNGFWTVAKAVTAFTVAHSITLIGTILGVLGLPQNPVESVIALSIMFLAIEIIKKDPTQPRLSQRIPWLVSFLFGLLHGFGFAGALKEIGLPETDVPTALLTFNLGVEGGQLIIVTTTLAILALVRRFAWQLMPRVIRLASYAIGITASFWFIQRTFA
jgi:hydrogenase/urease accessory protein HupE